MTEPKTEIKQNKTSLITVKSLFKSFITGKRTTVVLKDLNVNIYKGDFLVIFGPSGCGKSTLLHAIMGLEKPDAGEIKLGGINIWDLNIEDRSNIRKNEIGIMYQNQNWIKSLSVEENIAFSGQLIGLNKEEALQKANELLVLVGMENRKEYSASELSSGEQQKIGLARALMNNPKIIISDEPTGNLDLKSGKEMMDLFKNLNNSGKTIVMVTHNPEYLKYANHAILMVDGEKIKDLEVTEQNEAVITEEIIKDLNEYTRIGDLNPKEIINYPPPTNESEDVYNRNIFEKAQYTLTFNLRFALQLLLLIYLKILEFLSSKSEKFKHIYSYTFRNFSNFTRRLDGNSNNKISSSINSLDLTEISIKNLQAKSSRSLITIVGMGIGIGFIVFLLSLGFGLEKLVINEVTKIQNMHQIDVIPSTSSNVYLDKTNVDTISKIAGVKSIYPLKNIAARISYEKYITDVVLYGVQKEYIDQSTITVTSGDLFSENKQGVVVNEELLTTIGITPAAAINKDITLDLLLPNTPENADLDKSLPYKIIGVVNDSNPPDVYLSLNDIAYLNSNEYSQLRLVVENENVIPDIRKQIEVLGFESISIMDTVTEIQSLFNNIKIALIVIGSIALSIAVLGMFNTLTVSLLERTKEVGLMKTIGMRSDEIRSLFINESMLMGVAGGFLGIIFGVTLGLIVSSVLSIFSIAKGGEFILISVLPIWLSVSVIVASIFVGFVTGLYPSERAVKMPPLDALRYE